MAGYGKQFVLLLWKNWILQKRKVCVTVFETILPILFAILLVVIRINTDTTHVDNDTTWSPFAVDNGLPPGGIPGNASVLYTPDSSFTQGIMRKVESALGVTATGYTTEKDLEDGYVYSPTSGQVLGGVVFNLGVTDTTTAINASGTISYKIRPPTNDYNWQTGLTYSFRQRTSPRNEDSAFGDLPSYYAKGFLALQYAVDAGIIESFNSSVNVGNYSVQMCRIPYPKYYSDPFVTVVQLQMPLFVMLSFILNVIQMTSNLVYEKEKKLKESMKMMGLSNFIYWLSWFVKNFIYLFIACLAYALLLALPIGNQVAVLAKTNAGLFFIFLLVYASSLIAFCFAVSVFFQKANTGAAAGGVLYFMSYFPYFFIANSYETMTKETKLLSCLLPNVAMALGVNIIGYHEGTGAGAQFSNINEVAIGDDNLTLLDVILMLLADIFICLLITWYVDAVRPGDFGFPQPFYFPCLKSYWCDTKEDFSSYDAEAVTSDMENKSEFFENSPTGLNSGISIRNLRRTFGKGSKKTIAVAGMSLNMYEGQITALLGHNGAGKTTTMSMITGFLPPTSGTAVVNGFDIRKDLASVRKSLGLCPQHDILFDSMTVEEHLKFFAQLKGCPRRQLKNEVNDMMTVLGLAAKKDSRSSNLSGGQKRKLSVGIALSAGSKVVILDEPTSGMDPDARRQIWDILQNHRDGRTLLMTTHFMDEADILGDRIAIMAEGVIKCCGSSLFLKNKYGAGYHMIIVKTESCDVAAITELVQSHVSSAVLESDISAELSYILHHEESARFENLFLEMEQKKENLGIFSFGASVTTMEEVFLRVGETKSTDDDIPQSPRRKSSPFSYENKVFADDESSKSKAAESNGNSDVAASGVDAPKTHIEFNQGIEKNTGCSLYLQQFYGMFVKKIIHTSRNRVVTLVQLLLPVFFTIMALTVDKTSSNTRKDQELPLNLSPFPDNTAPYSTGISSPVTEISDMASDYLSTLSGTTATGVAVDLTTHDNISQYFLSRGKELDIYKYNKLLIVGAEFVSTSGFPEMTGYFSGQPYHVPPISLNLMMNALLRHLSSSDLKVEVSNSPLPQTVNELETSPSGIAFSVAFNILFGMAFLATSFVIFLIKEKETRAKHVQSVSGVHVITFWAANFTWDFINYLVPVALLLVVFVAFQTEAYVLDNRLGLVFLLFMLYGWAILPFMYLLHFGFKTPAGGMAALTMLNILTGLVTLLTVFILKIESLGAVDTGKALQWIFSVLLPNFCLGQGILDMYNNYDKLELCGKANFQGPCNKATCGDNCISHQEDYLSWDEPGIGRYLIFMFAQGLFFLLLVILIESRKIQALWYTVRPPPHIPMDGDTTTLQPEDSDVAAERKRINKNGITMLFDSDTLILQNLSKYYGDFLATDHLCLGVPKGETFGLLGVNGAGKTTTFKMMTGDVLVSGGNAYLNGYDVKRSIKDVQRNLGYCPQFDALIDQMTGRETLRMYARLRGIQSDRIEGVIENLLKALMLESHAEKQTVKYSGGNKRKLSTAIALIGDPPIIFLDEPTTGMDPGARRQLWNVLADIRASGRTLILTSHSMEECDALCTRLAIMVNGEFKCLGSPQHLKSKFGMGYTLICRVKMAQKEEESMVGPLKEFIQSTFRENVLLNDRQGYLNYQLTDTGLSLAHVFGTMERAKEQFCIEDYSVGQTTLEQVFLNFARNQKSPKSKKKGICSCLCCCK